MGGCQGGGRGNLRPGGPKSWFPRQPQASLAILPSKNVEKVPSFYVPGLTGGPIYVDGKRVTGKGKTAMGEAKGTEDLHLITWDSSYMDNGAG